jgi:glutathione S-transferase
MKLIVHGLDLSYFTGKLEAYLRAKGIAYELREMTTRSFRECARATGVLQMPQVEMPDGSWLTDTTLIIRYLERAQPDPAISPRDPVVRFISLLLEDFGDETLWRPALYYRWAFGEDAALMSSRLARGMLRDVPLPFFARRQMILRRQQMEYLRRDGVTRRNSIAIEQLYFAALAAMEQALEASPFVMGSRPTEGDFGLFGSMFRHFFSDPTPARIMRAHAPRTLAWVTRLWSLSPSDYAGRPLVETVPVSASGLMRLAVTSHLPYYALNAKAVAEGRREVTFLDFGVAFTVPASPYRAWCFAELQREFQNLSPEQQAAVMRLLADDGARTILSAKPGQVTLPIASLPIRPAGNVAKSLDRNWI